MTPRNSSRIPCEDAGTAYAKTSTISLVAEYAAAPGIQKQNRVTQSHPGPLRPEHRQQGLCPHPGPDTEANHSQGSTAEETTQQHVKSRPQDSSTRQYRYGTS